MSFLRDLANNPGRGLQALCAAQIVFWTLAPLVSHDAPPLDVVEMYVWGREGVVATFKHPNLPGLVLAGARWLAGGAVWPSYLVSQFFVVAAFVAVYALGRELLGGAKALAGTLLLTGVFYYSWPTPEFNHNVAQMPLWAGVILALWRAVETGKAVWWIALGALGGLSLWAKYSSGILLAVAFVWMIADPAARRRFTTLGPWLALAVFLLVAAPQIHYLISTDLLPLDYARRRGAGDTAGSVPGFLGAQIADHVVLMAMAAVAGLFGRGAHRAPPGETVEARGRWFLTVMGFGPLVLAIVAAAAIGSGLKDMWGAPMFNLSGLVLLAWLPGRFSAERLARIAAFAAVLLVLVPVAYAASVLLHPNIADKPLRVNWPERAISRTLVAAYEKKVGHPPRFIAGPVWEAGLVALDAPGDPSVYIDAAPWKSPWISAEDIARQGMLIVWPASRKPPRDIAPLIEGRTVTDYVFPWSPRPNAREIRLSAAIVPPSRR